jgi:hypothetical protein
MNRQAYADIDFEVFEDVMQAFKGSKRYTKAIMKEAAQRI